MRAVLDKSPLEFANETSDFYIKALTDCSSHYQLKTAIQEMAIFISVCDKKLFNKMIKYFKEQGRCKN